MNANETIADIVEELRNKTGDMYDCTITTTEDEFHDYADRIEAAAKREIPQPDPDWKTICEKCKDGEILPDNCEYFGEPNGCNSPLYGQHPKEEHGNAVAIRDALVEARKVIKAMGGYWARITLPIIDDALSKPPKPLLNCDVGTAEEQAKRMDAYCASHGERIGCGWRCENCPLRSIERCELAWGQMPYEEGGAE